MIVGVAINNVEGRMYFASQPYRHADVIQMAIKDHCQTPIKGEQGFITDQGVFLDRRFAKLHAEQCGQFRGGLLGSVLTSEDLW